MSDIRTVARKIIPSIVWDALSSLKQFLLIQNARIYHRQHIRLLRKKIRQGKIIKVLFIDSEPSKWKSQSLYEAMDCDEHFDPIIGVSICDSDIGKTREQIKSGMAKIRDFHEAKGSRCVDIYDAEMDKPIDILNYGPDIIFYQQPWNIGCHNIQWTYQKAFTCYIPYFLPSYGVPSLESQMVFHRYLALYFLLSDKWIEVYRKGTSPLFYSGRMVPVGHTMLDLYHRSERPKRQKVVIYAPHYSISKTSKQFQPAVKASTFLENGKEILAYAKQHPEIHWVYKPHPVLKTALVKSEAWTAEEVESYYTAWSEIGEVCETGDYMCLFEEAFAMITDCGSFLTEFGATGKPIIHLISSRNPFGIAQPSKELFATYYQAHNLSEMFAILKCVIGDGNDPRMSQRHVALRKANLIGQNASKNIIDFFSKEFKITR